MNGIQKYGQDFLDVTKEGSRDLWYGAAAFASWTVANGIAGYRKAHEKKGAPEHNAGFIANHQTHFCLGSIFATHAKPATLPFFLLGLYKSMKKAAREEMKTWKDFAAKHLTPQRLRTAAYVVSAVTAAVSGKPLYVVPYALWMLGNARFDGDGANASLRRDFASVRAEKRHIRENIPMVTGRKMALSYITLKSPYR